MVSVLWISGAPGVGKSTAGWGLYRRLCAMGRPVAYFDVDQLGLFAPSPVDDPERRRLQARNAVAVVTNFARHGATQVTVSGVVDPAVGLAPYVPELDVTLVRLHATWDELRRRYIGRGFGVERLDELAALAGELDRGSVGVGLDVTSMTPEDVLDALVELVGAADPSSAQRPDVPAPPVALPVPVLLITGATAVGKSTVGWDVFNTVSGRGITAAYIDADQLGFTSCGDVRRAQAENLLSIARGHCAAGARCLVVVAGDGPDAYADELAGSPVTRVHLDAGPDDLAARVALRAGGVGPRLAGDGLLGASPAAQCELVERAVTEARAFRRGATANCTVIDTSGQETADITRRVLDVLSPVLPVC